MGVAMMEAAREEETLRYGASLLAQSVFSASTDDFWDPSASRIAASSTDAGLAAFAQLATFRLNTQRCLVSLFDGKRQHIVAEALQSTSIEVGSNATLPADGSGSPLLLAGTAVPRTHLPCEHVLDLPAIDTEDGKLLPISVVPDLSQDDRFSSRPYCRAGSPLRFYASVPLRTPHGIDIGVCCVVDSEPRESFGASSQRFLRHLSRLVMSHLQARISTESYRRNDRMVRGLGSMVEGLGSMSRWKQMPNPTSFEDARDKDGELREGALNARQQRIQRGYTETSPPVRPIATPVQTSDSTKEHLTSTPRFDSTDTLGSDAGSDRGRPSTAAPKIEEDDNTIALKSIFSRAANIIRESVEVEGTLFLDAKIGSFGRLVPQTPRQHETESASLSRSGSSGEESWGSEESTHAPALCRVLAYSTTAFSSINDDEASREHLNIPDAFYERLGRRYPQGQVINFDDEGSVIWAVSDSEKSDPANGSGPGNGLGTPSSGTESCEWETTLQKRIKQRPRKSDGAYLMRMFPGARSVAIVPLMDAHKSRWFAAGFVWTKSRSRVFDRGELSYLKAFASATMAEVVRMDVLRENKAKEDVLGSLSHEIRSPLHGLFLGVELLHDSILTGFQVDVLRTVETCGRTLLDTLDHLLDFSKVNHFLQKPKRRRTQARIRGVGNDAEGIEAGMMSLFSEMRLDLLTEEVIESVYAGWSFQDTATQFSRVEADSSALGRAGTLRRLETVRRMDSAHDSAQDNPVQGHVNVHIDIDPDVLSWRFHVQSGALRRIIMNIFGNALKYTMSGNIFVSLSQEPFSSKKRSSRRTVVLMVSDSGRGISNDYLQNRLFTPFAQENQLSSGVGLGLSLVKQIVHGLGGRISVESQVDKGTTVRVLLPLRLAKNVLPPSVPQQADSEYFTQLKELEGASVTLLGFPADFHELRAPLAVKTGDLHTSSKRTLETTCRRLLGLTIIAEAEAVRDPPRLFLCTEHAMDQVPTVNGRSAPAPVVVVCDSALSAHQHQRRSVSLANHARIIEYVSQPIGPRKLARILAFVLEKARAEAQKQGAGQSLSLNTAVYKQESRARGVPGPHVDAETVGLSRESPVSPNQWIAASPSPLTVLNGHEGSLNGGHSSDGIDGVPAADSREDSSHQTVHQKPPAPFLLVDDNAINMKMLAGYMKKLGHGFDCASNGLEALDCAKTTNYRCIFMDISMPVMDGLQSTRLIRQHERQHYLQPALIIALTGLASAKTQQEAYGSGVDLFLSRPVPLKEIGGILAARGL